MTDQSGGHIFIALVIFSMIVLGKVKRLRIYIDTSVVGGCFDEEFVLESKTLFTMAASNIKVSYTKESMSQ